MKERPILFSGPMVRALLAGTKTQTRRVVKKSECWPVSAVRATMLESRGSVMAVDAQRRTYGPEIKCPYGQPGDRLWVRETWQVARETLDYETGGEYDVWEWPDYLGDPRPYLNGSARFGTKAGLFYAADGEEKNPGVFYDLTGIDNKTNLRPKEINWRPSIHMPRWASRITLEITSVRVERLQDIDIADAQAEGVSNTGALILGGDGNEQMGPIAEYAVLWEQINGPGSWEANPWVWVVEFRRLP